MDRGDDVPVGGLCSPRRRTTTQIIADNWPKYEHHKDAAYNAVLLRTTVGEHDKAIAERQQVQARTTRATTTRTRSSS